MVAPREFLKELSLIDKDYFCVWDNKLNRWIIRWWRQPHRRGDELKENVVRRNSVIVMRVAFYGDKGYDIGYHPLDNRVLCALKRRKYLSERRVEDILGEVDEANKKLEEYYEAEDEGYLREAFKTAWNTAHREWSKP